MKIKARKALALITSFVMLAVCITNVGVVFASDEYSLNFTEDFSNLSVNESVFDAEGNTTVHGGVKQPAVVFSGSAEKVMADSVDGAQWVTSKTHGFMNFAKTFFYDDKLVIESYTGGLPSLTRPSTVNLKFNNDIKSISKFKFTTYPKAGDGYAGARLFVSENENDYIWVGYKEGGCAAGESIKGLFHSSNVAQAFVIKVVNGVATTVGITSETAGSADNETGNWRSNLSTYLTDAIDWEITIDDGVISWTAKKVNKNTGAVNATWSSSYCDEDTINLTADLLSDENGEKWFYPISFSATLNHAAFDDLEITYYDSAAPEKMKMTLCSNLAEGQNISDNGIIKFNQTSGGKVVGINCVSLAGQTVGLSENGNTFTDVTLDENGIWTQDAERNVYTYAKLCSAEAMPEDLLIFGDMAAQVYDITRFGTTKIYETMGGEIIGTGSTVLSVENDDASIYAQVVNDNEIYGKRGGEVDLKYTSSEGKIRTAKIRIVDELTRVVESNDPIKMSEYLEKQNSIFEILNNAIKANDAAVVFDFFTSTEQTSFYGIDAVKTNEISDLFDTSSENYDSLKANRFVKRLMTHTEGFSALTLDELYALENTCLKEIRTDLVSEAADVNVLKTALEANNDILNLPLDNKYYVEHEDICLSSLAGRQFESYLQLLEDFTETYIIESFKAAGLSQEYAANLIKDSKAEIGYDEEKFNKIENVQLLAKELLENTDDINTIGELKSAIDSYEEPEEEEDDDDDGGSRGGGGGGSRKGGGGFVSITTPPSEVIIPQKPSNEPFVDKAQLFSDVTTDHWSYEAIRYMVAKGAVNGYEDGSFLPDNSVTRAEFVKLAVTAAGIAVEGVGEEIESDKIKKAIDQNGDGTINSKDLVEVDNNGDGIIDDNDKVAIDKNEDGYLDDADKVDGEFQYMFEYDYEYEYVDAQVETENTEIEDVSVFSDIQKTDWFYPYLVSAKNAGLFMGDSIGTARPNDLITKEECAAILYRLINTKGYTIAEDTEIIRFADDSEISDWASYAVFKLQVMGIVNGYEGSFGPKNNATRAESAKMIFEIMSKATEVKVSE